jgi:hypothetical protein
MASSRTRPQHSLSDYQLDTLVQIVVENFGPNLNRQTFIDAVLALFEDLAGFETLTQRCTAHYRRAFQQGDRQVLGRSETFRTTSAAPTWSLQIFLRTSTEFLPSTILTTPSDCFYEPFRLTLRLSNIVSG